ncbi:MAG: hypothetical protein RBS16_09445 [Candidatus Cloacimonadales bacterium]|jgi:hypothetical protein|nr:hypothetical protein [Candidatus Cloacimonadota bacterium]MDD3502417.1 hypothetical protein [Candidatus Cloacimonadota bacterium]MDX9978236.1 hypothetical protein [Candidatus Cloacimonadales bacterium]
MKVYLKNRISAYSGKDKKQKVVYAAYNYGDVCIAKNYTKPRITKQNIRFSKNSNSIVELWRGANQHYKAEFAIYANIVKQHYPEMVKASSYAYFCKIVYVIADKLKIEPCEVNFDDFEQLGLATVAKAMNQKILEYMEPCESLISPII